MATRTSRIMKAAVSSARSARQWAVAAARSADRFLAEARKQAKSKGQRRQLKQSLVKAGRVLKAAGRSALVAAVATGIAAAFAERDARTPPTKPKGRKR